jgi:small subunit ribosomal protein S15
LRTTHPEETPDAFFLFDFCGSALEKWGAAGYFNRIINGSGGLSLFVRAERLPDAQQRKGILMDKAKRSEIISKYGRKEGDTGSPEVQIALLSARILELTEHLKANKKDHSTRRGLLAMVSLRKKLLAFLMRENLAKYIELTDALGIRRAK